MTPRAEKIDDAVADAGQLISALEGAGPLNGAHARLIVEACVRAAVGKYQWWELEQSVRRVLDATGQAMGAGNGNQSR